MKNNVEKKIEAYAEDAKSKTVKIQSAPKTPDGF
jgi:hypothetical protein